MLIYVSIMQSFPAPRQSLSSLKYQRPEVSAKQGVAMGPLKLDKENVVPFGQGKNPKSKTLYFVTSACGNRNANKIEKTDVVAPPKPKKRQSSEGGQKRKVIDVPSYCSMELFHIFLNTHDNSSDNPTLIEQLQTMVAKSHKRQEETRALGSYIYQKEGNPIYEVFYWCKILYVNTATWFRTLELFNRFIMMFAMEMDQSMRQMDEKAKTESSKGTALHKPLRICSCILLASKIHSDLESPILTLEKIQTALANRKYIFPLTAIGESELRVFHILKYMTHWVTPFDLTEQMIVMVDVPLQSLTGYYQIAMFYLKFCYIEHTEFYKKVEAVQQNKWKMSREEFKRLIEYNAPLQSAVIVAAAALNINQKFHDHATKKLSKLISATEDVITTISLLLKDMAGVVPF